MPTLPCRVCGVCLKVLSVLCVLWCALPLSLSLSLSTSTSHDKVSSHSGSLSSYSPSSGLRVAILHHYLRVGGMERSILHICQHVHRVSGAGVLNTHNNTLQINTPTVFVLTQWDKVMPNNTYTDVHVKIKAMLQRRQCRVNMEFANLMPAPLQAGVEPAHVRVSHPVNVATAARLRDHLRQNYDVVHSFYGGAAFSSVGVDIAFAACVDGVARADAKQPCCGHVASVGAPVPLLASHAGAVVLADAHFSEHIMAASAAELEPVAEVRFVEAGADVTQDEAAADRSTQHDIVTVGGAARQSPQKQVPLLVAAVMRAAQHMRDPAKSQASNGPKLRLVFVGGRADGSGGESLRQAAEKEARTHGLLPGSDVIIEANDFPGALDMDAVLPFLARRLDIYVHTSAWDTAAYSLREAMAMGIPSIALKTNAGAEELLAQTTSYPQAGMLVSASNAADGNVVEALAEAIVRLATNATMRAAFSAASHARLQARRATPSEFARAVADAYLRASARAGCQPTEDHSEAALPKPGDTPWAPHRLESVLHTRCGALRQRPLLALLIMVKNEARNIEFTLDSALAFADHVLVVDTGSSDGTESLASAKLNSTIRNRGIVESVPFQTMSATRNHVIARASALFPCTQWFFFMDAGDKLENGASLRSQLSSDDVASHDAMLLTRRWLTPASSEIKSSWDDAVQSARAMYGGSVEDHVWLGVHRPHRGYFYHGDVHDRLVAPRGAPPAACGSGEKAGTDILPSCLVLGRGVLVTQTRDADERRKTSARHAREGFAHLIADVRQSLASGGFEWIHDWDGFGSAPSVAPAAAEARSSLFELARLHAAKGNASLAFGLYQEVAGRWLDPFPYASSATSDDGSSPACSVEIFLSLLGLAWLGEASKAPWDEVAKYLDRARRCDPMHPEPLAMLAVHHHASGDGEMALTLSRLVLSRARLLDSGKFRWVHRPSVECVAPVLVASHAPSVDVLSAYERRRLEHAIVACGADSDSALAVRRFLLKNGAA